MTDAPGESFISDPIAFIAGRIVERYSHPSRMNFLYLFQLTPGADFQPIVPAVSDMAQAWVDEGGGLQSVDLMQAASRCQAVVDRLHHDLQAGVTPRSRDDRRRLMARQVSFSITPPDGLATDKVALVDLFSRAIAFTPKSDRRVLETWRPFEGGWFSAYKPPE